jgi:hypothetical protein
VTAYDHKTQGTVLLGAGCAGYNQREVQTESLFNSHNLRENGVIVHDTTKRDSGQRRLEVDAIHINLDFVNDKTLSFKLRMPTSRELEELEVHWLSPRRLDLKPSKGGAIRHSPAAMTQSQAGNAPELITV